MNYHWEKIKFNSNRIGRIHNCQSSTIFLADSYQRCKLLRGNGSIDVFTDLIEEFTCLIIEFAALLDEFTCSIDQFPSLIDGFAALIDEFEALIDMFTCLIDEFAALIDEFAALIDEFAALIDEFADVGEAIPVAGPEEEVGLVEVGAVVLVVAVIAAVLVQEIPEIGVFRYIPFRS